MDFTLEEIRCILEEMGIKNIPESHLKHFARDLKHLMKHEKHVQKRKRALGEADIQAPRPTNTLPASKLLEKTPPRTSPTISQPMARPSTSFYPPHQQENCKLGAGKKLSTEDPSDDVKNRGTTKFASAATRSASKAELDKAKLEEARWKKLKTDPVRLYGWYKTHWEFHGLD
ncbi:uncharacterized protein LOC130694549 [Daphnia carinata]|uniref:uncharacterized protein LOC130694549 n=1 Tax=Daphnia carinata TaxID=120202 RepID=UPI002579CC3E|nr:uncharacterized protein LOC130694549 [Daphnia carinata]